MSDVAAPEVDAPPALDVPEAEPLPPVKGGRKKKAKVTTRDDELSTREEIAEKLEKVCSAVEKGFDDQNDRADSIMDFWDCYNCELGRYQNYTGNLSQIFVPIVRNAVDALVTRYINQAFPQSGRHVEVVTGDVDMPFGLLSLLEHYIKKGRLRTGPARAILTNGQIEGQYNAYCRWDKIERYVVSRETEPEKGAAGEPMPGLGREIETIAEDTITDEHPALEALHDNDVLILPATAETVEQALEIGGSVTVVRRWTKDQIDQMAEDGEITEKAADELKDSMGKDDKLKDTAKALARAAGIYVSRGSSMCVGYETWVKLKVDDKERICVARFGPDRKVLGCKLNPYWNDRCPVLSTAVKKLPGVMKGESPVSACMGMQIQANDAANEAGHMLYFSLAPVLAVNPEKVSKWKELVSDVAAVWPVDPDGVKMLQWPNVVREALEIISFNKAQILETLEVSPGMLPQQTGAGKKRNQAEVALEQQVELLRTAEAVTVFEEEILTPWVQRAAEYDHQFRPEKDVFVPMFGELGMEMGLERIPPIQMGRRWRLQWIGVEMARDAARIQQQIGWFATMSKVPPQQYMGYRLDMAPLMESSAAVVFSPSLARKVLKSMKDELSIPAEVEGQMMMQGFEVRTHAADNDAEHLQKHMMGLQQAMGQNNPLAIQQIKAHISMHQAAMAMKQAAMAAQGQPGVDQGARQRGGPRPGAKPAMGARAPQRPNGAIHPDRMARAGAPVMPRKM